LWLILMWTERTLTIGTHLLWRRSVKRSRAHQSGLWQRHEVALSNPEPNSENFRSKH
jgi:hypothetical protein